MDAEDIRKTFEEHSEQPCPQIIMYDELDHPENCIYLYPGVDGMGHFCAILIHSYCIELFDPIGLYPDAPIDNPRILKVPKRLERIFANSSLPIEYNNFDFQRGGSDCALWCILRFLYRWMTPIRFIETFDKWTDFDICKYFNRFDLLYTT